MKPLVPFSSIRHKLICVKYIIIMTHVRRGPFKMKFLWHQKVSKWNFHVNNNFHKKYDAYTYMRHTYNGHLARSADSLVWFSFLLHKMLIFIHSIRLTGLEWALFFLVYVLWLNIFIYLQMKGITEKKGLKFWCLERNKWNRLIGNELSEAHGADFGPFYKIWDKTTIFDKFKYKFEAGV